MAPQRQQDEKMAKRYAISVEVLREGMPSQLHRAPDGQIVFGAPLCVRVASAKQLEDALDLIPKPSSPSGPPPAAIDCYIVPYLPPNETLKLRQLLLQRVEGVPSITVHNMGILDSKEEVLGRIGKRVASVEELIDMLQNLAARLHHENPAGNVGHLLTLKTRYVLCKIRSGDIDSAKSLLKDLPGIEGNAADFEQARILEVANELSELYLPDLDPVAENGLSDEIGKLILAEVSSSDWHDKMQMIDDDPRLLKCIEATISELQRRVTLYTEITTEPSLIGA